MKKLIAMVLLCASVQAVAVELEGMKIADTVQLENTQLMLNGAGVRRIAFFKMYAVGLYLAHEQHSANVILSDTKPKRIALHVLPDEVEMERFLNGFHKGIEKNYNEAQLATLRERMAAFDKLFAAIKNVKRGDVLAFDWVPADGARITLNGTELGRIAGEDFYRALLSIWIGDKPVKGDLKKAILGN